MGDVFNIDSDSDSDYHGDDHNNDGSEHGDGDEGYGSHGYSDDWEHDDVVAVKPSRKGQQEHERLRPADELVAQFISICGCSDTVAVQYLQRVANSSLEHAMELYFCEAGSHDAHNPNATSSSAGGGRHGLNRVVNSPYEQPESSNGNSGPFYGYDDEVREPIPAKRMRLVEDNGNYSVKLSCLYRRIIIFILQVAARFL
jgi:hypothetical protein